MALLLVAGWSGGASAGTIYTNRAAWEAALATPETTITFEGLAADNTFAFYATPPGLDIGGVHFGTGASTSRLFVLGKDYYYPATSVLSSQQSASSVNVMLAVLPVKLAAVGFDYGTFDGSPLNFCDATPGNNGGCVSEPSPALPGWAFFGYIADPGDNLLGVVSVSGPASDAVNIDNFSFARSGRHPVAEPLTLAMFGAGVSGVAAIRRRKRA
jgi:hypothetical protein